MKKIINLIKMKRINQNKTNHKSHYDRDIDEDDQNHRKKHVIAVIFLNILLLIYSLGGVCSKKASGESFFSPDFILLYGVLLAILFIYAIGWQQIIKVLPLTTAYANKAITVVWGIVWGCVFFSEQITPGKLLGALLVVIGVVIYSVADNDHTGN